MKSERLKAYGIVLATFLVGAAAGAGVSRAISERELERMMEEEGPGEGRRFRALERELDLTSEQAARVREIFRAHRHRDRTLMRDAVERCGAELLAERKRVDSEIRAVLTEEQRPRFDELMKLRRERFGGGPPRRHRP